ncbi:pyrin-like [Oreochromis aureus]|uniref:B30.2/SPRY domain-containing protein n=1 Tax=Oreochromis aureus TaxID=47969 RepID=A0AAZ1XJS9_OREAU|nr:pyrin-like [Oreochromis aureus]
MNVQCYHCGSTNCRCSRIFPSTYNEPEINTESSAFKTPQSSHQTTLANFDNSRARQVLQAAHFLERRGTAAQQTAMSLIGVALEEEKKAKQLHKAKHEKTIADFQQQIHIRETKMAEVRSSELACQTGLDAEWLEVNNFFTTIVKIVEGVRETAIQPVKERRWKVERDTQDLLQKLQREIDVLNKAIDETNKNPDLEVSPQRVLKESNGINVHVDTSLSLGTLKATTSTMMKQICEELDKLSTIEFKRILTFAVDVKLDPTTAHQSLEISDDGKQVRDAGKTLKDTDSPQRFDVFGSVLGLNRLSSGRAYWEVEVKNKTGWDLGVTRRYANRKGNLSINPDSGYWVIVHYEEKKYSALTTTPVSLSLKGKPQKVGVFVDYEEDLVSFYDVTSQSHIYSFTECLFGGEILPYFSPHLKQNEKNSNPLIISAVQKQQ